MNKYFEIGFYLLLFVLFFSAPLITTFDSAWYHKYSEIFFGLAPWATWDFVRGIGLPIVIVISHTLFGYSSQGMLIMLFLCFLAVNIIAFRYSKTLIQKLFILIFFTVNPFVLGYFHVLLPEPFGIFYAFLLYYILSEFKHGKLLAITVGFLIFFAHQTKESITIFLLPALLISLYFESKKVKQTLFLFSLSLVVFYGLNKITNKSLKKVAVYQASGGDRSLISGIAFGNARSTLFQDRPYRTDSIISKDLPLEQAATQQLDGERIKCLKSDYYNMIIFVRDSSVVVDCKYPNSITEAFKINLFFLKNFTISYFKTIFLSALEILLITNNRYDEVRAIGFYMYKDGMSNVIPIEVEGFDFQKYVEPYSVESPRPMGLFAKFFFVVFSKTHILGYSLICLLGILIGFMNLAKKNVSIIDAFVLSGFIYLVFSAFLGMINDRYFILIFPFSVIICAKQLDLVLKKISWFNRVKS